MADASRSLRVVDSGDTFSSVHIESLDPVSLATNECERHVLRWYRLLLKMLGWMPFTCVPERVQNCIQVPLITCWVVMILVAFVAQILSCFRRDTFAVFYLVDINATRPNLRVIECKENVWSSFVITDVPILIAYGLGVYLFSKEFKETEYLSNLAERAFIQSYAARSPGDNTVLVKKLRCFMMCGLLWIVLLFTLRILAIVSLSLFADDVIIRWGHTELKDAPKITSTLVALFGFLLFDVVYSVAVMNHAAQCEMNIHLLRATKTRVKQKIDYPDINAAIQDIQECHDYLRVLNGKTALITSLILFNFASFGCLALISVDQLWNNAEALYIEDHSGNNRKLATAVSAVDALLWLLLLTFPFIQAARVSYTGDSLKAMSAYVRSRPFNYRDTSQLDKDSLLQFSQAIQLHATMCGIPIYPWTMYAVFFGFAFIMLILIQTGVYSIFPFI